MIEIDPILQPIAGSDPCGVDLEYDSRFQSIRDLVDAGSPEVPIEWKKVQKLCLELLSDGRSVELLVTLSASLVATDGFQGLRDGMLILSKSLQDYWDTIYPKLDADEPEDERYDMRLNSVAQLGEQPRKMGDQIGYVEQVLRAPLSVSGSRSAPAYWSVWESEADGAADPAAAGAVNEAISRMDTEERNGLLTLLDDTMQAIASLNSFLIEQTGSSYNAPYDEHLLPVLRKIHAALNVDSVGTSEMDESVSDTDGASAPAKSPTVGKATPVGAIQSSTDVKKALEKIIAYYRKAEPSSPLPFLLLRAQKLVDADFMEIVKNLNQDSEHQFRTTLDITESD